MGCSDSCSHEPMDRVVHIYQEVTPIREKVNGHSCRSVSKVGEELTHTKEMEDGRLFLYYGTDSSEYEYYQINCCPFCGFKAKQQIV